MSEIQQAVASEPKQKNAMELSTDTNPAQSFLTFAYENQDHFRSIAIVVPVRPGDDIEPNLSRMLSVWSMSGMQWCDIPDISGGFIECMRAGISYNFVHDKFFKPFKFLVMIDNDMSPQPSDVWVPYLLTRHNEPVVGGCAVTIGDGGPILCFTVKCQDGLFRFPAMYDDDGNLLKIPSKGLLSVNHVGTGVVSIRRDVLESFSFDKEDKDGIPFFVPDGVRKSKYMLYHPGRGEDVEFSNQCKRKGFDIKVDLEAHIGHRKPTVLRWFDENRDDSLDVNTWLAPPFGRIARSE